MGKERVTRRKKSVPRLLREREERRRDKIRSTKPRRKGGK